MSKAFIEMIAPLVLKYDSPLFPSVRIAQACLESGYGTSKLATEANNLFGIKASAPWKGESMVVQSREEGQGIVSSAFRKYGAWEESIKDHAGFITSTPWRRNH